MFEQTSSRFPAGSIRAAVERHADAWRDDLTGAADAGSDYALFAVLNSVTPARDAAVMLTAERVRLVGITPAQRATWAEYLAARKCGAWL